MFPRLRGLWESSNYLSSSTLIFPSAASFGAVAFAGVLLLLLALRCPRLVTFSTAGSPFSAILQSWIHSIVVLLH